MPQGEFIADHATLALVHQVVKIGGIVLHTQAIALLKFVLTFDMKAWLGRIVSFWRYRSLHGQIMDKQWIGEVGKNAGGDL